MSQTSPPQQPPSILEFNLGAFSQKPLPRYRIWRPIAMLGLVFIAGPLYAWWSGKGNLSHVQLPALRPFHLLMFGVLFFVMAMLWLRWQRTPVGWHKNDFTKCQLAAEVPGLHRRLFEVLEFHARLGKPTNLLGRLRLAPSVRGFVFVGLALAALLLPTLALDNWSSLGLSRELWSLISFPAVLIAVLASGGFAAFGARHFLKPADLVEAEDGRPPTLLLRSFLDDDTRVQRRSIYRGQAFDSAVRLEVVVAERLHVAGPFVGIGAPREGVPRFGAARAYLTDADWQARVLDWIKSARLIAMLAGPSEWVVWELKQIFDLNQASKLILLLPPTSRTDRERRWKNMAAGMEKSAYKPLLDRLDLDNVLVVLLGKLGDVVVIRSPNSMARDYEVAMMVAMNFILADCAAS